jgi:PAS domain S-box-containing protein
VGVVLSLLLTFFITPVPLSRPAALGVTLAIALYNLPAALAGRRGSRLLEPILVLGLAGDFCACTAWLLLTGGDTQITFLIYVLVAIEAAAAFGWIGTAGFLVGFLVVLGARVWEVAAVLSSSPPTWAYVVRSAVVLVVAVASAVIATRLQALRQGLAAANLALQREREGLHEEATDRRQAEQALDASQQRLLTLVRNAPVVLLAIDRAGQITFCEGAGLAALGRQPGQWVGWSVKELYPDRPEVLEYVRQALSGQTVHATIRDAGRTLAVSYGPSRDGHGELVGAIGVALDITEAKQVEAALHEQTELYEALIRAQSDLGDLVIVSEGEKPIFMNAAVAQISGYSRAELDAMPSLYDLVPEADRNRLADRVRRLRDTAGPRRFDGSILHKAGHRIELEASQLTINTGGRTRTFTIARDVTARQQVEAQRQALLSRLVTVQEEERRQIANGIHDDSIQTMFAVKIRLHLLRAETRDRRHLDMLAQVDLTIDQAITRLRRLVFDLGPVALDQEGLVAAIRLYLDQMRADGGPDYEVEEDLEGELSQEARAIIYRIAQEALANVRKHAQATRVTVSLAAQDGGILVHIHDDGRGFLVEEATRPRPGHLGLAAMRERAEMAGGWLQMESAPGAGAAIEYWIPLAKASARPAA